MIKYTPFLKLKANEVGAISELTEEVANKITPFFDLPTKRDISSAAFCDLVDKASKKIKKLWGEERPFYLDNFDIPDDVRVRGKTNYTYVIEKFSDCLFVPVLGLNRTAAHNLAVIDHKRLGDISSDLVAIRLEQSDFEDFALVEEELSDLIGEAESAFEGIVLVLDCRLCLNANAEQLSAQIHDFIEAACEEFDFSEIVVTGSSIPASIGDIVGVNTSVNVKRVELEVFSPLVKVSTAVGIGFGDYTVVSPLYSDLEFPKEMLRNVTAPKILYSSAAAHFVMRGAGLKNHPRGNLQYNDMLAKLIALPIYRGPLYSEGDDVLAQKARMEGSQVTPSSIIKPTINAHISYMVQGHRFV